MYPIILHVHSGLIDRMHVSHTRCCATYGYRYILYIIHPNQIQRAMQDLFAYFVFTQFSPLSHFPQHLHYYLIPNTHCSVVLAHSHWFDVHTIDYYCSCYYVIEMPNVYMHVCIYTVSRVWSVERVTDENDILKKRNE